MPPPALFDFSQVDLNRVVADREQIYSVLPHRHEFMQLDGICSVDTELQRVVAFRNVAAEEWWCKGHLPGRPLLPGVLMIESAAHVASYYYACAMKRTEFLGFARLDDVKFRGAVVPPSRLILIGQGVSVKPRRMTCDVQAFLNGDLVMECRVTGMMV